MRILVFVEGTATHKYVPTKGTVDKLKKWRRQGAEISYLTYRRANEHPEVVEKALSQYKFPKGKLYFRKVNEEYIDVVRRVKPDVLVEDNCKSIGYDEVIAPKLLPADKIKGIIVPEHGGLGHLPDNPRDLAYFC